MAAAAGPRCRRCAGQARGGRPVTGRGARMTGIRRQEAQSGQAAALLAGSLERQAAGTRCQQNDQLRVRAGRGVLRKQAEMPSKTPPTGPRSENENMLGTRTRADPRTSPSRLGHSCKPRRGGSAKCGAKRCAKRTRAKRASRRASGGWVVVNPCATRGMDGA
jgi:hypothetical protein